MATPFSAAEYTIHHISIDPSLLRNFSTGYYEAGHMMYIDERSHAKLRADITKFIEDSLRR
jgi:carboxypeptidase C (cathepsin A)